MAKKVFPNNLREAINQHNLKHGKKLTHTEIAFAVITDPGISDAWKQQKFSAWVKMRKEIPLTYLKRLSNLLDLPMSYIAGETFTEVFILEEALKKVFYDAFAFGFVRKDMDLSEATKQFREKYNFQELVSIAASIVDVAENQEVKVIPKK